MTDDALLRESERLFAVAPSVAAELHEIVGLRGVAPGVRQRGGKLTGELALRVYVTRKRPLCELAPMQRIPPVVRGEQIDVHSVPTATRVCCNATRPLLAGLWIQPIPINRTEGGSGTLGCFLTLSDGRTVLLTCAHVLAPWAAPDATVYQPKYKHFLWDCNNIGETLTDQKYSIMNDVVVDDGSGAGARPNYVDASVAHLERDFVPMMVKIDNGSGGTAVTLPPGVAGSVKVNGAGQVIEIRDGANKLVDTRTIAGTANPVANTLVWKIGAKSGLTVGVVTVPSIPTVDFYDGPPIDAFKIHGSNQLEITPIAGYKLDPKENLNYGGNNSFGDRGDSGSVILDLQNNVVGHLHHVNFATGVGTASRFGAVLAALGAKLIPTSGDQAVSPTLARSNLLAREAWLDAPPEAQDLTPLGQLLEDKLATTALGRAFIAVMREHLAEVVPLVLRRRAVTVVWHRHHGPAFVALGARALVAGTALPTEVDGVSRRALLGNMADALARFGSPALRVAIEAHRPWLLELAAECRDVDALVARLREAA
jgi:hypothetical protein